MDVQLIAMLPVYEQKGKSAMKRFTHLLIVVCLSVVIVAAMVLQSSACFTVLVGKDASETGRVMVTHNEDDGGRAMVDHGYVPPKDWPAGSVLPAEEGRAAIPQVSHTLGYYWSQLKPASGGYSNADAFYNDAGVLIVSNSNASSKVDTSDESRVTDGGIEYNLRRVLAERATSARHGVEICIDMVETWGYAPSGRAYTIADQNEAWMVQIISGKYYVAVRCPDDAVIVMPNHYTVHDLNLEGCVRGETIFYPDDLIDYAKEKGFYQETDGVFDFAKTFQAEGSYRSNGNTYRQYYGTEMLLNGTLPDSRPDDAEYPLWVKVEDGSITLERLMEVQSEHYEGTSEDAATDRAPGGNPHDTTLRRICTGTTDESLICVFDETPLTTTLWTAFGHPCELPYIPLHPLAGIPEEIDQMEDSSVEMANHLLPDASKALYEGSGWSKFKDFQTKVELTYSSSHEALDTLWAELVDGLMESNAQAVASAKASPSQAKDILAAAGQKATTDALNALEDFADEQIDEVAIQGTPVIPMYNENATVDLVFTAPEEGKPKEATLRFGLGMLNIRTTYITPVEGSLKALEEKAGESALYQVTFRVSDLIEKFGRYSAASGSYDYFLGGETDAGTQFTAMVLADVRLSPFADVATDAWYFDEVVYASVNNLMNGTGGRKFSPDTGTTRGMIVTMLYRLAGSPEVTVEDDAWYAEAQAWAKEQGISDGSNMEGAITREQLAAMLYRYAAMLELDVSATADLSGFADYAQISDYAADALEWANASGIVNGRGEKRLAPQEGATRAETAAMFMRFAELTKA